MKTPPLFRFHILCGVASGLLCLAGSNAAAAAALKEARVTQIIHQVNLLPGEAAPRPAAVSDEVRDGISVRTGTDSRAELTFADTTITRLGATTLFSFSGEGRTLDLGGGALLLQVPKGAGGAKIRTPGVTAGITGTTVLFEFHPKSYFKLIVLEGQARLYENTHRRDSVVVNAGYMLIGKPGARLGRPVMVDLARLMKTSGLITKFRPLSSAPLIAEEVRKQRKERTSGVLIDAAPESGPNDPTALESLDRASTAFPTPPPSREKPPGG